MTRLDVVVSVPGVLGNAQKGFQFNEKTCRCDCAIDLV